MTPLRRIEDWWPLLSHEAQDRLLADPDAMVIAEDASAILDVRGIGLASGGFVTGEPVGAGRFYLPDGDADWIREHAKSAASPQKSHE